jgi:sugar/nucleoside kinase (ribokinase family)
VFCLAIISDDDFAMLTNDCRKEVLNFLEIDHNTLNVTLLPDFFQDRLISLEADIPTFESQIEAVAKRKGGSIDDIAQTDLNGGNAINTASALAALGAKVMPIVCTDTFGLVQIRYALEKYHADLSRIKIFPRPSKTTALEFRIRNEMVNVMLRDVGDLAAFGPSNLTESDYLAIESSDYTCLFNWAGTRKHGTELAHAVFRAAKRGKGKTYFDTADPTPNVQEISILMEKVLKTSEVDTLSLNENEAISYAKLLSDKSEDSTSGLPLEERALRAARILSKSLPARIDLHTTAFSATFNHQTEVTVPSFRIQPLRATGAGDAWNAGNIIGDHNSLSDETRLTFANLVSACYLTNPEGNHPNKKALVKFLKASH